MCGILGAIGNFSNDSFIDSAKALHHRGPDFTGYLSVTSNIINHRDDKNAFLNQESNCAFAHTRLSIIDLKSESNQPFVKHNKVLTYNGEIYNYIELRKELIELGYSFTTQSDTEVLISALDAWGESCLEKLNGMWSFCLYDHETKKLFIARDRFGIKPFYYYNDEQLFAFSSEIKSLVKINTVKSSPNLEQLVHYLYWGQQEVQKETMFLNINKLIAGHSIKFDFNTKELLVNKYYDIKTIKSDNLTHNSDMVEKLNSKFKRSIELRMRADVPVAVSLSGGLDSSSILMESSTHLNGPHNTFSIVYDKENNNIDESKWIDIINSKYKTTNYKAIPTYEDLRKNLKEFIYTYDEPIRGTTFFAQWRLMKLINSNNIRVSLEGQGGDEVFGGYLYTLMMNNFFKNFISNKLNTTRLSLIKNLFYMKLPSLYEYLIKYKIGKKIGYKGKVPKNINQPFRHKSTINDLLKHELSSGIRILLRQVDRASMAFSIESRVPYLDHEFVEDAFKIPSQYKTKDGWTRYLQRQMFSKRLPDEIVWRKDKLGFPTPHAKWMERLQKDSEIQQLIEKSNILKKLGVKLDIKDPFYYWKIMNIAVWEDMYWK